jgi:hypothetical protein
MTILANEPDSNAIVSMVRPPDYRIETVSAPPDEASETFAYGRWITPQKDRIEVVKEPPGKYWQLSKQDSDALFAILKQP